MSIRPFFRRFIARSGNSVRPTFFSTREAPTIADAASFFAPVKAPLKSNTAGTTAAKDYIFLYHGVKVRLRKSCENKDFKMSDIEEAFKKVLDAIFISDCIEKSRREAIQRNLKRNGYEVRCQDSNLLRNKGACAESTGFSLPANIMTIGSKALKDSCGDLSSTMLHEIIHITRGTAGENLTTSCEASCFGFGASDPRLCRNIDIHGKDTQK